MDIVRRKLMLVTIGTSRVKAPSTQIRILLKLHTTKLVNLDTETALQSGLRPRFTNPDKKICGFKNVWIRVDMA